MNQDSTSSVTGWQLRWLAEAVRLSLSQAPDLSAERQARAVEGDAEQRILAWARYIADRDGLMQALLSARQRAVWALVLLLVIALFAGFFAAMAVLGDRSASVNVIWALGALLGANLLMLLIWLLSFFAGGQSLSLGRFWFWLSARFQHKHTINLARAFAGMTTQAGLSRWWLGAVSHLSWMIALLGATIGLLLALSLRSYAFTWETTILPASVFESVVQTLGWLPGLLGFSVPDLAMVQEAGVANAQTLDGQPDAQRRVWASWLIGCLLIYGVLPRFVLGVVCLLRLAAGLRVLSLPLSSPIWNLLSVRLSPDSEHAGITDPAPAQVVTKRQQITMIDKAEHLALIEFELGKVQVCHPDTSPAISDVILVDSREDRQQALVSLRESQFAGVIFVCQAAQSPDRGSLNWLSDAMQAATAVRVWLLGADKTSADRLEVWRQSLLELGVPQGAVFVSDADARAWLGVSL